MRIKQIVYFDKPGERTKLEELVKNYPENPALALAIEREFNLDFSTALIAAEIWLTNNKK